MYDVRCTMCELTSIVNDSIHRTPDIVHNETFCKRKSPGEPGDNYNGWVSKYREINFPTQY